MLRTAKPSCVTRFLSTACIMVSMCVIPVVAFAQSPPTTIKIDIQDLIRNAARKQAPAAYLVFFDQNLAKLTPEAQRTVEDAATQARAQPDYRLEVIGHDDSVLPDKQSLTLSQERAAETANFLVEKGVAATRIFIGGVGSKEPLVPTARGVAEPQNRFVRIQIVPNAEKTKAYLQPFK